LVGCCHGDTIHSNLNNSKIIVSMDDAVCIKKESLSLLVCFGCRIDENQKNANVVIEFYIIVPKEIIYWYYGSSP
jgi:hypothetical protein